MSAEKDAPPRNNPWLAVFYCIFNIVVASGIVFANKAVFSMYHYNFVFALTLIHTIFTFFGMHVFSSLGFFQAKKIPPMKLLPLAFGYVGYIVLCNVSLQINSVGFYQIMKIAVAPTVLVLEFLMFSKLPSTMMIVSVVVVCAGITIATVTDVVVISNTMGLVVGLAATLITALYQIWAGSKQKELQANSSQLLQAYTPQAILLLAVLVPIFEPMGWKDKEPGTLLGYQYTTPALFAIIISAILGILVSLSTFLVIGATSSLTYNIVGHFKTVIILTGGCFLFGDIMPWKRVAGICVAMVGIIWYTQMAVAQAQAPPVIKISNPPPIKTPIDKSGVRVPSGGSSPLVRTPSSAHSQQQV